MYSWTASELLEAVERANKRGVAVQIILDKLQSCGISSLRDDILKDRQKWNVKIMRGGHGGIQHHKFCIIDNKPSSFNLQSL